MNFISAMDLVAAVASLAAFFLIWRRARRSQWKPELIIFTFIIVLTLSRNIGNLLEWSGITAWFDPVEDYMEVLTAALWAFFLYTFHQELTEQKLREVQKLDEKILDGSPVAFVLRDADLKVIRVSKAFENVTGYDSAEVLEKKTEEFIPDMNGRNELNARLRKVLETGEQVGPTEMKAPTPLPRYIRENIFPVLDRKGNVTNTLSVLEDITERKLARDALKESETRYRKLFDNIHDGVVLHDIAPDGRLGCFIEVNTKFCSITGYSKKDLLKMSILDLLGEDQVVDTEAVIENLLKGHSVSFERAITRKTGERVTCELNAHLLIMGDRQMVLSMVRDITERKETQDRIRHSLAEKETLLREVHHRVKNNLQVISGLLNLQSLYIDDAGVRAIYKESQNRIKTMALIHEELYQREDLAHINLADYIQNLTDNLMASYSMTGKRVKLALDLEDIDIVIDTAIPVGLIVNELVSNALKHAFPGRMGGEIKVSLRRIDKKQNELVVLDNGIGLPEDLDIQEMASLGLRLVSILAEQLDADLKVEAGGSTTFKLTFGEYFETGTEVH